MTLDELSQAWNNLRNAALGRGNRPLVNAELAGQVYRAHTAWRAYLLRDSPPVLTDMMASALTRRYVTQYRQLLAKVEAAGGKPKTTLAATTPYEDVQEGLSTFNRNVAIGLGVIGGALIIGVISGAFRGR